MVAVLKSLSRILSLDKLGRLGGGLTHTLHEQDEFRRILQRERTLVDRNGHAFSVIVLVSPTREHDAFDVTLNYLDRRIRTTDELGWLDATRVGVLLRCTDQDGAWKLAQCVAAELVAHHKAPVCRVYTYPSDNYSRLAPPDNPDQRKFTELFPGWDKENGQSGPGGMRRRSGSDLPPAPSQSTTHVTTTTYHVASDNGELCEPLLAHAIPFWKRVTDIVVSLLALTILSPVMLLLALFIKLVSPGPVFFRQERIGYMGRPFVCWKFRTMKPQADTGVHQVHLQKLIATGGPMVKLDNKTDNRLIPFAKVIRASGLDELPQILNVLKGDMSLIGPRPCIRYEYEQFSLWHRQRFNTLPGLTGLWQVSGKNRTTFLEMMRLDIGYTSHKSIWKDLSIMLRTVPAVISEASRVVNGEKKIHVERN
ncbi:MAG: sugar transferase [Lentisphaerae bacterium]|nr:sugar transferase [Lentisphaerota bacterium]